MKLYTRKNEWKICVINIGSGYKIQLHEPFIEVDGFINRMEKMFPGVFECEPIEYRNPQDEDLTGKTLLITRRGGYGDILWITAIVRALHLKFKDLTVNIACHPRHHMVMTDNQQINKCVNYPIPKTAYDEADYHLTFERCIEVVRDDQSVYDLFAGRAGVELDKRVPTYSPPIGMAQRSRKWLKSKGVNSRRDQCVMIHLAASTPWKSWPPEYVFGLACALGRNGVKVFLAGNKNNWKFEMPQMKNVFQICEKGGQDFWPMDHTVALMTKMDLFIGPDSGLVHFSAAMGVPSIAIYGPFPAMAYVRDYDKCTHVENFMACQKAPCHPHLDNICTNMDDRGYSKCLLGVRPEFVLKLAEKKLGRELKPLFPQILMKEKEAVCA